MKLALAQIDMRLGDIEGICGRIEDQVRLAHERGARVLCVPAPLFMGALPGGLDHQPGQQSAAGRKPQHLAKTSSIHNFSPQKPEWIFS